MAFSPKAMGTPSSMGDPLGARYGPGAASQAHEVLGPVHVSLGLTFWSMAQGWATLEWRGAQRGAGAEGA